VAVCYQACSNETHSGFVWVKKQRLLKMVCIGFETGNLLTHWLMDFFCKVLLAAAKITAVFSSSSYLNIDLVVLSSGGQTYGNYIVTCMGDGL
jgi:hypothetical protein